MKILQVNCVYQDGSTGKIVHDIHRRLIDSGIESVVCYGRGGKKKEPGIYKVCSELYSKWNNVVSRITGIMYGGCFFSTMTLISTIKKEQPDIVHLHCINGYFVNIYKLIKWLKKNNVNTILTLHAEFMYTANCGHALECERWKKGCGDCPRVRRETRSLFFDSTARSWRYMMDAFAGFRERLIVTSVSAWLMERAKTSPILGDKEHRVVFNGLNIDVFHMYDSSMMRKKLGIRPEEKIIFHATPKLSPNEEHIKGGFYVIKMAKLLEAEGVKVVVAGEYDKLYDYPDNMIFLGRVGEQQKLAELYSLADVTVLTSKKETFSMVTAESLCCGTPIVGFLAGAPEQIAIKEYSLFVEQGDIDALVKNIKKMMARKINKKEIEKLAHEKYSADVMCDEYMGIYKELYKKGTIDL